MPYKDDIFRELEVALSKATPEQVAKLLSDLATGRYAQTAQTRAGTNDDRSNVTDMVRKDAPTTPRTPHGVERRTRYSS
ncbi:MAG: hypothetical protein WBG95_12545 [Sulfitobacter sp.]